MMKDIVQRIVTLLIELSQDIILLSSPEFCPVKRFGEARTRIF